MNEQNEIMGDWYEEVNAELEREEGHAGAPEVEPLTDEELDDWADEHGMTGGARIEHLG